MYLYDTRDVTWHTESGTFTKWISRFKSCSVISREAVFGFTQTKNCKDEISVETRKTQGGILRFLSHYPWDLQYESCFGPNRPPAFIFFVYFVIEALLMTDSCRSQIYFWLSSGIISPMSSETEDVLALSGCRDNHNKKIKKMLRTKAMKKQLIMKKKMTIK